MIHIRGIWDAISDDERGEFSERGRGKTFLLGWIVCCAFGGTVALSMALAWGML